MILRRGRDAPRELDERGISYIIRSESKNRGANHRQLFKAIAETRDRRGFYEIRN